LLKQIHVKLRSIPMRTHGAGVSLLSQSSTARSFSVKAGEMYRRVLSTVGLQVLGQVLGDANIGIDQVVRTDCPSFSSRAAGDGGNSITTMPVSLESMALLDRLEECGRRWRDSLVGFDAAWPCRLFNVRKTFPQFYIFRKENKGPLKK